MKKKDGYKLTKNTKYIREDGTYWETQEQIVSRYNDKGYLYRNRSDNIKAFLDKPYPEELSWAEKGKLGRLEYEIKSDQMLAYKSGNTIKPHTISTIGKILDTEEQQTRRFIKRCKKYGVIGEAKIQIDKSIKKCYFINPRYKLHGNRVSLIAFLVFEKELKREIPSWVISRYLEDMRLSDTKVEVLK